MHEELAAALGEVEKSGARALIPDRAAASVQDRTSPIWIFTPGAMTDLGDLIDAFQSADSPPASIAVAGDCGCQRHGCGCRRESRARVRHRARGAFRQLYSGFREIGLVPDSGGTWFCRSASGMARALGLAITGVNSARRKPKAGASSGKRSPIRTRGSRGHRGDNSRSNPRAIAGIERAMRAGATQTLDQQLDLERDSATRAGCVTRHAWKAFAPFVESARRASRAADVDATSPPRK